MNMFLLLGDEMAKNFPADGLWVLVHMKALGFEAVDIGVASDPVFEDRR
jgi:hypothetical protein